MKPLSLTVALLLLGTATAQRAPLPGIPVVPVNHPALMAQPLMQPEPARAQPAKKARPAGPEPEPQAEPEPDPIDPETVGVQKKGRELKACVKEVVELGWARSLDDAKAQSAATGKPILWLQTLGDISGYA